MSTLPLVALNFRGFNANNAPLAGGKLYTYAAGTTTPLSTYTTRAGNIANANPVVLDANGEADVWTTPGVLYKFVLKDASDVTLRTVDNVPSGSMDTTTTDVANTVDPGGRLTLTTGTPVTTTDVTGATTVFYALHTHNKVPLYDGSAWTLATITELSQALSDSTKSPAAAVANKNYDLFVWNDSGTLRLSRGPPWSSSTSRGTGAGTTEISRVEGRYVNTNSLSNGPAAQRGLYVGTIHTNGSAQIDDSLSRRGVWNAYNRLSRPMRVTEATLNWTYSTDSYRQANNSGSNSLEVVVGLPGEDVGVDVLGCYSSTVNANRGAGVGIGLDSTTVDSSNILAFPQGIAVATLSIGGNAFRVFPRATYQDFPGIGWHFFAWLERGFGSGSQFWLGTNDDAFEKVTPGIWGHVFA